MNNLPKTKKSLGQHWLSDPDSLTAICQAGGVSLADTVLEIGPGAGTLTTYLARAAKQVIAVELDQQLAADLPKSVPVANVTVVNEDILTFDLSSLPTDYKVVANIPYYLTSHLIRILSESPNQPQLVVILVQKEVAERVAAKPGQMSLLSVTAQFYWETSLESVIPAELFVPAPSVDSQILVMKRRSEPLFLDTDAKLFFRLVKAGFANRRKTLLNSLSAGLHIPKEQAQHVLHSAGIKPTTRPQELSLSAWHKLYKIVNQ